MLGNLIVAALLALAIIFAIPAVSPYGLENWLSLTASSLAFTAMGINLVLAMRLKPVEKLFGGLDRLYFTHKWLGISIIGLIVIHWYIKPNFSGLALSTTFNTTAAFVGKWTFYALLILLLLSAIKRLPRTRIEFPYHIWRWTHRFIGIAFIFLAFHQAFIKRPFGGEALLSSYLNLWALIGIAAYLYVQIGPYLKRRGYTVTDVDKHDFATLITAKPDGRPVKARPGQFAFIKVKGKGLEEPHPFTIAGPDPDGTLHFAIKPLGDFTARLRERIEPGDKMVIEGGYGGFNHGRGGKKQIWLAGGIGITPFLAWARHLDAAAPGRYHLIHCVRGPADAVGRQELEAKSQELENFAFTLHSSENGNRLTADKILGYVDFEPAGVDLWFCGPPPLRKAIEAGLKQAGVNLARVEFERFEFR
ncbi:ferredoxin reductase family protein [Cucumibacter marinus]|uniref:ferredoxin reductase family protein n=1 Tax=Cucumibacter marinus TaxID=1121252 RepID=UPI0004167E7B|nr:ferredoxin reductase family protein [Cucumibacter marinus]